jgi:type II secretion system protein N
MMEFDSTTTPPAETEPANSDTYQSTRLRRIGIIVFGVVMFFFFLLIKLPEARIQNLLMAHIRIMMQNQGLLFNAEKIRMGVIFGLSLKMEGVEIKAADDDRQVLKIPYLKVSPHLLSLPFKTKKASIKAETMNGSIDGMLGASATGFVSDLDIDGIDVGATTLLRKFIPVDLASGKIDGTVKLDLNMADPSKSDGTVNLAIKKLAVPAQPVMGINLPALKVSQSKIQISIAQGAITIRAFEIGKDPKTDDLILNVTGTGTLDRALERSRFTGKATFKLAPAIHQSIPILDALLGQAKQPDGSYAYRLNGPLIALEAQPGQ